MKQLFILILLLFNLESNSQSMCNYPHKLYHTEFNYYYLIFKDNHVKLQYIPSERGAGKHNDTLDELIYNTNSKTFVGKYYEVKRKEYDYDLTVINVNKNHSLDSKTNSLIFKEATVEEIRRYIRSINDICKRNTKIYNHANIFGQIFYTQNNEKVNEIFNNFNTHHEYDCNAEYIKGFDKLQDSVYQLYYRNYPNQKSVDSFFDNKYCKGFQLKDTALLFTNAQKTEYQNFVSYYLNSNDYYTSTQSKEKYYFIYKTKNKVYYTISKKME